MDEAIVKGLHRIDVTDNNGNPDEAVLEIRYRKIRVLPPIGKQKRYPALTLTVIHAEERMMPCGASRAAVAHNAERYQLGCETAHSFSASRAVCEQPELLRAALALRPSQQAE